MISEQYCTPPGEHKLTNFYNSIWSIVMMMYFHIRHFVFTMLGLYAGVCASRTFSMNIFVATCVTCVFFFALEWVLLTEFEVSRFG